MSSQPVHPQQEQLQQQQQQCVSRRADKLLLCMTTPPPPPPPTTSSPLSSSVAPVVQQDSAIIHSQLHQQHTTAAAASTKLRAVFTLLLVMVVVAWSSTTQFQSSSSFAATSNGQGSLLETPSMAKVEGDRGDETTYRQAPTPPLLPSRRDHHIPQSSTPQLSQEKGQEDRMATPPLAVGTTVSEQTAEKNRTQDTPSLEAHYNRIVHELCQCKHPFNAVVHEGAASPPPAALPSLLYGLRGPIRRFLKAWFSEVMSYRGKAQSDEDAAFEPPAARLLFIGSRLSVVGRRMFFTLITQILDEGIEEEEDAFGTFARRVVNNDTSAGIEEAEKRGLFSRTWPMKQGSSEGGTTTTTATTTMASIQIRYEEHDNHDRHLNDADGIKTSLAFKPTHVFVIGSSSQSKQTNSSNSNSDGDDDDPATALDTYSVGLFMLRQKLMDLREDQPPQERNLYPPPRVVFWAMPQWMKRQELPLANHRTRRMLLSPHCRQETYFRDAYYAAVRRANGALLHQHSEENFDSVAIELFDYYATADSKARSNRAIIAQVLDLVSQPPQTQQTAALEMISNNVQLSGNESFLNATLFIPPPLLVVHKKKESRVNHLAVTRCPLSFSKHDVERMMVSLHRSSDDDFVVGTPTRIPRDPLHSLRGKTKKNHLVEGTKLFQMLAKKCTEE